MRALAGRIPRAFKSHRSPDGRLYSAYCRAKVARYGSDLPHDARIVLREAGRVVVEIEWLAQELDRATTVRKLTQARRLRRELKNSRFVLEKLELRLERLAGVIPEHDLAKAIMEGEL
ncbi:hypothetical protein YTPLAS18_17980 [Nitrospira sp.]|nr:hypothetical protein YTPLAS18_17980 [Nitrospira sp.]